MPRIGDKVDVTKAPQYGDKKRLEELASGTKEKDGVVVEREATGRPTVPTTPQQQGQGLTTPGVPAEHLSLMESEIQSKLLLAVAEAFAAMPTAGPWVRLYAEIVRKAHTENALALLAETPFFEG